MMDPGDANTGGGGSVVWGVRETDGESGARGKDPGKKTDYGDYFTISIKAPAGQTGAKYLKQLQRELTAEGNRVWFNLAIEKNPEQVRVSWGNKSRNQRGKAVGRPDPKRGAGPSTGTV